MPEGEGCPRCGELLDDRATECGGEVLCGRCITAGMRAISQHDWECICSDCRCGVQVALSLEPERLQEEMARAAEVQG